MALTSKVIASFILVPVLAGEGVYDEIVKDYVIDLAEQLALKDLEKTVIKEVEKLSQMNDNEFDDYLEASAKAVKDNEAVLLICLDVLASDLVISIDEMESYFAFADILGVSEDRAGEIFDDFVDETEDLTIENDN